MKCLSLLVVALVLTVNSACTGSRTLNLIRGINDISITAINANSLPPPNNLSDVWTARILTINKQLLDIIQINPPDLRSKLTVSIANARQALPEPVNAKIEGYLTTLETLIREIR